MFKLGLDVNIQYSPVKVTSKYEPHISKDGKLTNSVILLDSERYFFLINMNSQGSLFLLGVKGITIY